MGTAPLIGRNIYRAEIGNVRTSFLVCNSCLRELIEDPSPQRRHQLIAKMALAIVEGEQATTELERIGQQAREARKAEME